jgi:tight adherence protein C
VSSFQEHTTLWEIGFAISLIVMFAGTILLPMAERRARVQARIREAASAVAPGGPGAAGTAEGSQIPILMRPFGLLGRAVIASGLLSGKVLADLEQTMISAGYRTGPALSLFVGAKIASLGGLPLIVFVLLQASGLHIPPGLVMVAAAVMGLLLPDFFVRRTRKKYLAAVEDGLPSALDLLIICAEAGLALEAGFERVAEELKEGIGPTANELRITANEMKILSDRRQALINMGRRTGLESMNRLGGMLAQSMKYGTPLTQALRVLAAEMRQTLLTKFEAKAAKLPVMLTIPMILFILPCIFVIIGGPAAIQVIHSLHGR